MRKTLVILQKEYLQRVRKKSFLIMTLLGPALFGIMLILPVWLSLKDLKEVTIIRYTDPSGILTETEVPEGVYLIPFEDPAGQDADAVLEISPEGASRLLVLDNQNIVVPVVKSILGKALLEKRLQELDIPGEKVSELTTPVPLTVQLPQEQSDFTPAAAVSLILSIVIYLFILGYSLQVMRGVMEEKNSRVVEILLSSAKPFQLMAGKIGGIGLVSLTQFLIWCCLGGLLGYLISERYGEAFTLFTDENIRETIGSGTISIRQALEWNSIIEAFRPVDLSSLLLLFLFYFIGGYLFYSAIFAAAGSALDSETETQQFLFPLTLPILFTFVLAQHIITDPASGLSFWLSVIPFTSPVAMMLRYPSGVPVTELVLSMTVLVSGIFLFAWTAGKVFSSGILLQGKKLKAADVLRSIFYSK